MAIFAYRSASREGRLTGGKVPYRRAAKRPSARSRITVPSPTPASFARPYAQYCRYLGRGIAKFARKTSSRDASYGTASGRHAMSKQGIGFIYTEIQSHGAKMVSTLLM